MGALYKTLSALLAVTILLPCVAHAQEKETVTFGEVEVKLTSSADTFEIALTSHAQIFATTTLARSDVDSFSTSDEQVALNLKSGFSLVFSGEYARFGFVTIDYKFRGVKTLTSEEPVQWQVDCFEPERMGEARAFGTAGLKAVDQTAGSYAFLALVDPQTRSGVVGGWITSERAGAVVRCAKSADNRPVMTPRLDFGSFPANENDAFQERFVIGAFDDCRLGLESYADSIAAEYSIELNRDCLVGYCTWYAEKHGGSCDENSIKELVDALEKNFGDFGFQYVQIDDHWQLGNSKNGPNKNFTTHRPNGPYPSGMKATSEFLNAHGAVAGLWFMPFSGNYDDPWFEDKQDLFVRSAIDYPLPGQKNTRRYATINQTKGAPYETFWGGTCLDMSNPATRDYVKDVVARITQDWNYKFIKIDGLWCGAGIEQLYVNDEYMPDDIGLQIFHDPRTTNIENYRKGLELVRQTADGVFILGCNVSQNMRVMASSYGLVDAMRVGPDNGASWQGVCAGPWRGTNRYFYNARVWYNDPDPVYVRTSIPQERAQVSATWASLTGQLYALSDWAPDYSQERIDVVRKTIPNHQCKNVRPVDLFDVDLARVWILTDERSGVRRDVVGLFNWQEDQSAEFDLTPEKLGLPLVDDSGEIIERYVAYDFWNDAFIEPFHALTTSLPKESCAVYAIRPVLKRPVLLSTSRHITQGVLEVEEEQWDAEKEVLTIKANVPSQMTYELRVYNPATNELERFVVPQDVQGVTTVLYRPNESRDRRFKILH
ncbi:MAG: hypothetical protein Q4G03_05820 [Planctomycetia bacterium]|nr:hypothetical protein [Planctomycetia bacterium]